MSIDQQLRTLRQAQGFSLRALADAATLSPATLSQIESGQASPSVATLEKLADALGITVARFFIEQDKAEEVEVFSLDDRRAVSLTHGCSFYPLAPRQHQALTFEPMLLRLESGGEFHDELYGIQSQQAYVWVRSGQAELNYDGTLFTVSETQSLYYDPRKPHNWHNHGTAPCELLIVRSR